MKPQNIILEGLCGSKAYGLDTAESDEDIKGVYLAPTQEVLGLYGVKDTIDHTNPDWSYHELGKFIRLALKANPTILELLYLEGYRVQTKWGHMLVDNRHHFLSNTIYKSYGGYAVSQIRKLNARGGSFGGGKNKRYSKNARHCFRLLLQGRQLLETGQLTVRVDAPTRQRLFDIGDMSVDQLVTLFESEFKAFDSIKSVLPDKPNMEEINKLLLRIRKSMW